MYATSVPDSSPETAAQACHAALGRQSILSRTPRALDVGHRQHRFLKPFSSTPRPSDYGIRRHLLIILIVDVETVDTAIAQYVEPADECCEFIAVGALARENAKSRLSRRVPRDRGVDPVARRRGLGPGGAVAAPAAVRLSETRHSTFPRFNSATMRSRSVWAIW